jgi:hypothetical protein
MAEDPLRTLRGQEEMLFRLFGSASTGKNADAVMGAAVNIIMNAIRQNYALRIDAEAKINELFGHAKQLLLANHYDSVTGKRRNVFPHTQIVRMAYHIEDDFPQSRISHRPGNNR